MSRKSKCREDLKLDEILKGLKYEYEEELKETKYDTSFPLPSDVQHFSKALKSDLINFQTTLSLEEITRFYRQAFAERRLAEIGSVTTILDDCISIAFKDPDSDKVIVVQAVDLAYSSSSDLRNVNLRTEKGLAWLEP